jgi:peptidoglycan/LPS O-acetylase OafA/YrhL
MPGQVFAKQLHGLPLGKNGRAPNDNFLAIRITLALMVIYGHSLGIAPGVNQQDFFIALGFKVYSGDIAVNGFFFLSGLMVAGSWARRPLLWSFIKARFLRLMPALAFNLALVALVFGPLLTTLPLESYFGNRDVFGYIATNLRLGSDLQWNLPGIFEQNLKTKIVNGSLWTLPAEATAYFGLAFLGFLGLFRLPRVTSAGILASLVVVGALIPVPDSLVNPTWIRLYACFALGVLTFLMRDRLKLSMPWLVVLALLTYFSLDSPIHLVVFGLFSAYSILVIGYLVPPFCTRLEKLGDPSYGIYLWGWFSQQLVALYFPAASLMGHILAAMALAVFAGYASWHLVEKQALKLK